MAVLTDMQKHCINRINRAATEISMGDKLDTLLNFLYSASQVNVYATAGQSENLINCYDSSGSLVASIDTEGNVFVNAVTLEPYGVFASLNASASTLVVSSGSYYSIQGSFDNEPVENFSGTTVLDGDAIKYDGIPSQYFEIVWSVGLASSANGTTITAGIRKNEDVQTGSLMDLYCKTAGEQYSAAGVFVTMLEKDDTIQLILSADADSNTVTVNHFTTSIKRFF